MADDTVLYSSSFREGVGIRSKTIFVDLRQRTRPPYQKYLKISERGNNNRNTVHIAANKLDLFEDALQGAKEALGSKRKRDGGNQSLDTSEDTIFVGNLTFDTTKEDLEELFSASGEIISARIIMSGKGSAGAGLVHFAEASSAASAIEKFHDYQLKGRPLNVRLDREPATTKATSQQIPGGGANRKPIPVMENDPERTVFVAGFGRDVTQEELGDFFEDCGEVTGATLIMRGKISAGCGLVEYSTREEAESAVERLSGTQFQGRKIRVRFDKRDEINESLGISSKDPGMKMDTTA